MSEKIFNCNCLYNEVGEGTGNVKGYELVTECNDCKARREADNAAIAVEKQAQEEKDFKFNPCQGNKNEKNSKS